jgi:hypothetical protein
VLNLVKTQQQIDQDLQQQQQLAAQQSLVDQAGQMAGAPLVDPSKNPQLGESIGQGETVPPEEGS